MSRLKNFILLVMFTAAVSTTFSMWTPLSSFEVKINPLKVESSKHDLEALIYREEIMRYEQNRIFFLIKPYIQTRLRMG